MNITNIHDCYGCGVCATVCSRNIIEIALNADGFYEPRITDKEKCTDCGLCTNVCSYFHEDLSLKNTCVKAMPHGVMTKKCGVNVLRVAWGSRLDVH